MINKYLTNRKNLMCLFVLLDIRHKPQTIDLEFIKNGKRTNSFCNGFTKTDKLSQTQVCNNLKKYKIEISKKWEFTPDIFITSSEKKTGIKDILNFIETHNKSFDPTFCQ